PGVQTLEALAETVTDEVRALAAEFWPGGLTIVVRANPALDWDLGETRGTVALRVPSDAIALELLAETGPLAVSSANLTGRPAATTAAEAQSMLGDAVSVYLDGGPVGARYAASASGNASDNDNARAGSTIVDATALTHPEGKLRIVRHGVIPDEAIIEIVGADRCA
ncbi:MAG TPA: Sua5/YciO/YrdC/YwlC family protein, partial [Pseudolysinimonas sp.]|nr:Sua5/YciO/YrdC/YwlC family protein [Pseudolysinimonas sp.]